MRALFDFLVKHNDWFLFLLLEGISLVLLVRFNNYQGATFFTSAGSVAGIKLFAMDGIKLSYEEEALDYIVDKAVEYKLGARGLRSIMESIMIEAQYSAPSEAKDTLVITRQYAEEQLEKQKEKLSNVG